ncbi:MAG: BCCT family transporter [Planctomycetes bacterium]|nr:BCCT family transporter [Planctomycetota bacterium]
MTHIRPLVFFPPFLLCAAAVGLQLVNPTAFAAAVAAAHGWACDAWGWLVSLSALGMVVLCGAIAASSFGRTILGGPAAERLLTPWQLFSVVLTTNIAAGILFWCAFEPLSYLKSPPSGITSFSPEAARFAISTVLLHWTFTPYAIASVVGLMFAFAYYNAGAAFSLASPLAPLIGGRRAAAVAPLVDVLCLYALVAALAAALAGGSLILAGGIQHVLDIDGPPTRLLTGLVIAAVMAASVVAAASGVTRGIRWVANVNTLLLIGLLGLILLLGPTQFILDFAVEGLGLFLGDYFPKVLRTDALAGAAGTARWPRDWTQMMFSAFFAWAPIMGVFLGRIARGYSVRAFLGFNVLLPALFTGTWMAVICGAIVHMELFEHANLAALLDAGDPTRVLFAFLGRLPLASLLIPTLLVTAFLSFVTTADGITDTMANISSVGISPDGGEAGTAVKIAWGGLIAVFCWIMTGLEGIRALSNLGGLPALFLCLVIAAAAVKVMAAPPHADPPPPRSPSP